MGALITNGVIFSKDNPAESQIGVQSGSNKMYMYNKNGTDVGIWYTDDDTGYVIRIHDGTRTFYGDLIGNASNSDKLDGFHEYSFLRYRGEASVNEENTLWDQIGIKEYANKYPSGAMQKYGWGHVISLPSANGRLDLYATHFSSGQSYNGLQYRTGWTTNAQPWRMILDSGNFNGYVPSLTGSGAYGTWGINITGTAKLPAGFTVKHTSSTWGAISSSNYTLITGWATNDDASIDFLCYPNRTELSVKIDGYFFQSEGQYRCLDTSGGNFVDGASLQFTGVSASVSASTPTALSYGRLQAYGTLCINANTDNSGTEYIILTAGKGLSSSTTDGLAIGTSTLTWQDATIVTSSNYSSWCAPISHNHTSLTGITSLDFSAHSDDGASIRTTVDTSITYFDFNLLDDGASDMFRWNFGRWDNATSSQINSTLMTLTTASATSGSAYLRVNGTISADSFNGTASHANTSGYAEVARVIRGAYTSAGGAQGPNYIGRSNVVFNMMNAFSGGPVVNYMDCILMNTYGGGDVPRATGIGVERYSGHLWVAEGSDTSGSWAQVYKAWTSKNMRVGQGQPTHSAEYGDVYFQY